VKRLDPITVATHHEVRQFAGLDHAAQHELANAPMVSCRNRIELIPLIGRDRWPAPIKRWWEDPKAASAVPRDACDVLTFLAGRFGFDYWTLEVHPKASTRRGCGVRAHFPRSSPIVYAYGHTPLEAAFDLAETLYKGFDKRRG